MSREGLRQLYRKWSLALSVTPIVLIVAVIKYIYHQYSFEVLEVSPFMSGLIAANVFW